MNTTVVILAAGLGTRMKSKQAKVLHRAGGLPLLEHVIRAAKTVASPERIFVVTGHQAEAVEGAFAHHGVRFVRQTEQKGTGHALAQVAPQASQLDGQVMVLVGDAPLLRGRTLELQRDYQAARETAGTLISLTLENPTGYGRVLMGDGDEVLGIVEHKNCTPDQLEIRTINSGIYCFRADLLWRHLPEIEPNSLTGEYYLTDIFEILRRHGHRIGSVNYEFGPEEFLGINTRLELAWADTLLRSRKHCELLDAGVTIEQRESVAIDMDVAVGQDTIIEPHVRLLGTTRIGEDCRIGAGAILNNTIVEDGALIFPYTVATDSTIGPGAQVGPFARLRPNSHVGPDAEVGNFAELKNTRLGRKAKAHHVSYLGDSDVGEKVNIGAGTIVCNYDGVEKHRTRIGEGVFVGSNSTLVAPVDLGDGSYIAAGSVITENVPPDALALGRARQVVKDAWAAKRRNAKEAASK